MVLQRLTEGEEGGERIAYGFSLSPLSNFRAVTLHIKGWIVSGQLGRRRDPRARLEQPPFVQGITSARKREGKKKYFNAPVAYPAVKDAKWRISKITNRGVSVPLPPRRGRTITSDVSVTLPANARHN